MNYGYLNVVLLLKTFNNYKNSRTICPAILFVKNFSKYFSYIGNDEYMWNSTSREAPPVTKTVVIHNRNYCPYCAAQMFPIQTPETFQVIGYTCFCDGALSEVEYESAKEALLKKHEEELAELRNEYRPRLTTDLHTLFNIKQEQFWIRSNSIKIIQHKYLLNYLTSELLEHFCALSLDDLE